MCNNHLSRAAWKDASQVPSLSPHRQESEDRNGGRVAARREVGYAKEEARYPPLSYRRPVWSPLVVLRLLRAKEPGTDGALFPVMVRERMFSRTGASSLSPRLHAVTKNIATQEAPEHHALQICRATSALGEFPCTVLLDRESLVSWWAGRISRKAGTERWKVLLESSASEGQGAWR